MTTTAAERVDALNVLRMVLDGRISGRISEWPQLRPAVAAAVEALAAQATPVAVGEGSRWFAADPAEGSFDVLDSLEAAQIRAADMLEAAGDDAADFGWADDPPQICYGQVLGWCIESSRRPALKTESQFSEIVTFTLTAPQQAQASGGEFPERFACNGPEGTFWTNDCALANKLIAATFDRDEWTVTDTAPERSGQEVGNG